jgi:hypothetical protein
VRRLALSLAISGDKLEAEKTLSPLLAQRDLASWRTRAFALAILGQTEEAVSIANNILPADIALGVAPYLRYMPRLTRAQQAAAANFGAFPRASEIGRDDPRVAQYAPKAATDVALMPQGEPLGRKSRSRNRDRASRQQNAARVATAAPVPPPAVSASQTATSRVVPPEPQPARQAVTAPAPTVAVPAPAAPPARIATPAVATATSPPAVQRSTPPPQVAMAVPPAPRPAASGPSGYSPVPATPLPPAAPASPPPAPPASLPPAPIVQPVPAAPVQALPPRATPPLQHSLSDAFAEFQRPSTDATPAAGAVDVRRIKPAGKPAEPPKPPPPSHPSRIWVQIATGRDKSALGFDWRRMTHEAAEPLRGKEPFVTAWGQTNRLLTGPFQSEAAANSFIGQLRRANVDGAFVWTSPAGQVVDALPMAAPRR